MRMSPPMLMQRVALTSHFALMLLVALHAPSPLSFVLAAILLLPVPGILRGISYTFAWASMLVAFYVAGYLASGYARPETRVFAFLAAGVAAIDYLSLMMFVRFRARERAGSSDPAPAARMEASDDASR